MAPRQASKAKPQPPTQDVGDRLFLIRLACGGGGRPETVEDFVERVERATGAHYDPATISRLERGKQRWKLSEVEIFAAVDPLQRGREWLAWGTTPALPPLVPR